MGMTWKAPWRSDVHRLQYQTLDAVYIDKENVRWYWRLVAQIATYMILGGYLILPTTFDDDPRLRFNKSVLAIIIVALLTGGYSLTALVWFACPSILFRRDSVFLPVLSVSVFAFFCVTYALAASPRYVFSNVAAPTTLALTVASAVIYGVLAIITNRNFKRITRQVNNTAYMSNTSPSTGRWQDQAYYQNYNANMHPSTLSPSYPYEQGHGPRTPGSFDGANSIMSMQPAPSEEELVNQSFAKLLQRPDMGLNHRASSSTFRLEWPTGHDEEEVDGNGHRRRPTFDTNGRLLSPGQASRKRSMSASHAVRGIFNKTTGKQPVSREQSQTREEREQRRQEIEMNRLS